MLKLEFCRACRQEGRMNVKRVRTSWSPWEQTGTSISLSLLPKLDFFVVKEMLPELGQNEIPTPRSGASG